MVFIINNEFQWTEFSSNLELKNLFYIQWKEKEGCSFLNPPLQREYAHKYAQGQRGPEDREETENVNKEEGGYRSLKYFPDYLPVNINWIEATEV